MSYYPAPINDCPLGQVARIEQRSQPGMPQMILGRQLPHRRQQRKAGNTQPLARRARGQESELVILALAALAIGVAAGTFTWAWTELFVSRMEIAIAAAAKRLGALALAENDVALSVWAVLQGLSASLYDRELWHAYLVASARSGREVLERAWKSASAVMGDDCGDLIQAVDTLRSEAGIDPVSTGQGNRT